MNPRQDVQVKCIRECRYCGSEYPIEESDAMDNDSYCSPECEGDSYEEDEAAEWEEGGEYEEDED